MSDISLAPVITSLKPYLDAAAMAAITAGVGIIVPKVARLFNLTISDTMTARIKTAAATEAGALMAQAEDNLAGKSITIQSPEIAKAVANITGRLPEAVGFATRRGLTPDMLGHLVVAEVGKLQAQQPAGPK